MSTFYADSYIQGGAVKTNGMMPKDVEMNVLTLDPSSSEETKLKIAENRITSVHVARRLLDDYKRADEHDATRRARLQGHVNGNPPYDDARLEELGLGYMTNTNFLEMRAILDDKASTHYELFFEVPTLIEIGTRMPEDERQPSLDFKRIIAEEFTRTMFAWSGFLPFMDKVRRQADLFGLGPAAFRDEWDWRPRAFSRGSFLTDRMAGMDINELPIAYFRDRYKVGDLYRMSMLGKDSGWNQEAVKKLLTKIYAPSGNTSQVPTDEEFSVSKWETIEQKIRNNDYDIQAKDLTDVYVVHMFVQEVDDGKISHYIFAETAFGNESDQDFLYTADRKYERMDQCMWWLPANNGDGYLHSVRGIASFLEPHCDLSNRFLGRTFDAGFTSGSLLLQPRTAGDLSKLQLIRLGIVTVIPPEVQAVQSSFQPQIDKLIAIRGVSSDIMRNNTKVYLSRPEVFAERQAEKTARQVAEEVSREARAEKSNIAFDYDHIERLYREMFRRMTRAEYIQSAANLPGKRDAQEFIVRCVARGVPMELLLSGNYFEVYITRAIGLGSWGTKLDITNQVLSNSGMYDEQGRVNALREWLAVRVGYRNVDKLKSLINRDEIPSNEQSIATLENNDMIAGNQVPVGSDQLHQVHFSIHIQPIQQLMEAMNGDAQIDPQKGLVMLGAMLPHLQQTIQFMAMDPTRAEQVQQAVEFLKTAQAMAQNLQRLLEQQQKEAQKQQEANMQLLDEAQQIKQDREMELRLREIELKQASLNQARAQKTAEQLDIRRQGAAADIQLKAQRQAAELQMMAKKTDAEIEIERLKASQKMTKI